MSTINLENTTDLGLEPGDVVFSWQSETLVAVLYSDSVMSIVQGMDGEVNVLPNKLLVLVEEGQDEAEPAKWTLPLPTMEQAKKAAGAIIALWIKWMEEDASMLRGQTIDQWLEKAAADSTVMHDNCDANMVFDEALKAEGLVPNDEELQQWELDIDDDEYGRRQEPIIAVWNFVTFEHDLLEVAAEEALQQRKTTEEPLRTPYETSHTRGDPREFEG